MAHAAPLFSGLIVLFGILYALTTIIKLDVLNWLLSNLTLYFSLAIIIIFQPEIRRGLARIGWKPWRKGNIATQKNLAEPISQAALSLSEQKIGALIAIEREIGTRSIQDSGTALHATVTAELITSLFYPRSPLHDGGVIISGSRIAAAGCLCPLSQKEPAQQGRGTRHRAAIGITDETDAVVVVVSEETVLFLLPTMDDSKRHPLRPTTTHPKLDARPVTNGSLSFSRKDRGAETELSATPSAEKEFQMPKLKPYLLAYGRNASCSFSALLSHFSPGRASIATLVTRRPFLIFTSKPLTRRVGCINQSLQRVNITFQGSQEEIRFLTKKTYASSCHCLNRNEKRPPFALKKAMCSILQAHAWSALIHRDARKV